MNNTTIICLSYAVYLLAVGIILAAAWYSEKLDPDNDLPPSIWDEILPSERHSRVAQGRAVSFPLQPALAIEILSQGR